MDLQASVDAARSLIANVERVMYGKRRAVTLAVTALLADVHLLVTDVPGVGKTVLARCLARSIDGEFRRIQGTPDLLPSDVTGSSLWHPELSELRFAPGPVFTNVLLFDEINRATPRTQSALMEVMDEGCVSMDGQTHELPDPFFVVATANPAEHHGTYPLPEGELDRFGLSTSIGYPDTGSEREVVRAQMVNHPLDGLDPVMRSDELAAHRLCVRQVRVAEDVLDYALALVSATRRHPGLRLGASPRATLALTRTAQAMALIRGRDYVLPDDVQSLAAPALTHRVVTAGSQAGAVVEDVVRSVRVPVT